MDASGWMLNIIGAILSLGMSTANLSTLRSTVFRISCTHSALRHTKSSGDPNRDGRITVVDAVIALQMAVRGGHSGDGSDYLLSASNNTLMRMLKEHLPLADKTLKIMRSGHGFETQYMVEEVHHKKHWQTKLLTRLCSMTRTALVALFLWFLRELLDYHNINEIK